MPELEHDKDDLDALVAVAAHNLLGTMSAVSGLAQLLDLRWHGLDDCERHAVLGEITKAADSATLVLLDLVRLLPSDQPAYVPIGV